MHLVCEKNDFAFFNFRSEAPLLPDNLQDYHLAFRLAVSKDAPSTGGWELVGRVELKSAYTVPAKYLHKPVGSDDFFIYSAGEEKLASKEDCRGLEIMATWFPHHVEERLEDYFAGRESKYVIAIKKQLGI